MGFAMASTEIWLDRSIFNDEIIARTAHRYTNRFHVAIRGNANEIGVILTAHEGVSSPVDLEARFRDDALDERLRQSVREETQHLHAELIRAALRESLPAREDGEQ